MVKWRERNYEAISVIPNATEMFINTSLFARQTFHTCRSPVVQTTVMFILVWERVGPYCWNRQSLATLRQTHPNMYCVFVMTSLYEHKCQESTCRNAVILRWWYFCSNINDPASSTIFCHSSLSEYFYY